MEVLESFPLILVGRIVLHCGAEDDSTLLMVVIMMMAPRGIAVLQQGKGGREAATDNSFRWRSTSIHAGMELTMLPAGMGGYFSAKK